jgi:hypothetical protein
LSLTNNGKIRYELKTPYRDGTTHVAAPAHPAPAALVRPCTSSSSLWISLPSWPHWCPAQSQSDTFHGVFAPNSKYRALVTPAKRGKGSKPNGADGQDEKTPVQRHAAMTWAQRLKRVFNIDVEKCRICGGTAKVIACIEDPVVIKILTYLEEKLPTRAVLLLPDSRAPPQSSLFG